MLITGPLGLAGRPSTSHPVNTAPDDTGGGDTHVDRGIRDAWNARRRHRHERLEEGERNEEPDAARGEREQQALGERQARESKLACAEGGPDREFSLALGHTREHEVGDVQAGDQQTAIKIVCRQCRSCSRLLSYCA